ncbi:DUF3617 domain-containing protein [Dyella sp.]|uniref:DUF3617 domain-containing protein n=1 Tax=Dyella sp. TaxID=1869338 RepID=UPI002ED3E5D4
MITVQQRRRHLLQALSLAAMAFAALAALPVHADPGDFGAMPGLWKIVTRMFSHGQWSKPTVQWHCVDEGADPWPSFGKIDLPGSRQCQVAGQHRASTSLDWTLHCDASDAVAARGHVGFDSAEHYTAHLTLPKGGDVVRVEGKRYAACTSPAD